MPRCDADICIQEDLEVFIVPHDFRDDTVMPPIVWRYHMACCPRRHEQARQTCRHTHNPAHQNTHRERFSGTIIAGGMSMVVCTICGSLVLEELYKKHRH